MRSTTTLLALLAACAATCWAYAAGLQGGFLFDDWVNLDALGATGPVDDWATFLRYITSGAADPTGRPLALLSFLLDANDWPAHPAPFLRTNLVLHLINGVLLFALLRILGRVIASPSDVTPASRAVIPAKAGIQNAATPPETASNTPALIAASIWLLHPLFVSTTLYVVQREAMLSTLFVLLGLLAYGHGRLRFAQSPRAGLAWMLGGLAFGTLLALACKANGILLPLLAWVLEATLFSRDGERRLRTFRIVFLVLPSALLFAWLTLHFARYAHAPLAARDWTIAQRLLTEPRVLLDYLQLLFVPRAMSNGLFNDAYAVSTGWLHPWTTLASWCVVVALIAGAIALRRRAPAVSAAILFFFAGHLIESSVLALELYYEHRNYLPAMLAFWPLARALCAWKRPAWQRGAIAIAVLAMLAATTHARATLWGQPERLAATWVALNPASPRAQATAAAADIKRGRADLAERRLSAAIQTHPRDLQLLLNLVDARCQLGGVDRALQRQVRDALRNGRMPHALVFGWIDNAMVASPCFNRQHAVLATWIDQAAANPAMQSPPRRQDIAGLRGRLALLDGDAEQARQHFDAALSHWPTPQAAARNAADLATHGHLALAIGHLDYYDTLRDKRIRKRGFDMPALHAIVLERQHYWDTELQRLRARLITDSERAQ